jgi:hypothetical protein
MALSRWFGAARRADGAARRRTTTVPRLEALEERSLLAVDINNGIPIGAIGQFGVSVNDAGSLGVFDTRVTAAGNTRFYEDDITAIFEFANLVDVGSDGAGERLGDSFFDDTNVVTQPAIPVNGGVLSSGSLQGLNGRINWSVFTVFEPGTTRLSQAVTFSSDAPLGTLRYYNYLDQSLGFSGLQDILAQIGTPGQPGFELATVDTEDRVGFAQGGVYVPGPGLANAAFEGFLANEFIELRPALINPFTPPPFSLTGVLTGSPPLPSFVDPVLGPVLGPENIVTALAWQVDPNATTAVITTTLRLVATPLGTTGSGIGQPPLVVPPGTPITLPGGQVLTPGSQLIIGTTGGIIVGTPPPPVDDGLDDYVRSLYATVLGRDADEGGLAFHLTRLRGGFADRDQVARDFVNSREFFGLLVRDAYLQYLDRPADDAGLQFFVDQLAAGASDADLVTQLVTSDEYTARFGATNESYVRQLYTDILFRAADLPGLSVHLNALNGGVFTREQIALNFLSSAESINLAINLGFQRLLGRAPDPAGQQVLFTLVSTGVLDPREGAVFILASDEFFLLANA